MHPDDVLAPLGGRGDLGDGDRRGVRRQDGVGGHEHRVELAEHRELGVFVLEHGLDDELAVGHLAEIGAERHPRQRIVTLGLGDLAGRCARVSPVSKRRRPASMAASWTSHATTSAPERRQTSAIPAPMAPHPTMPIRSNTRASAVTVILEVVGPSCTEPGVLGDVMVMVGTRTRCLHQHVKENATGGRCHSRNPAPSVPIARAGTRSDDQDRAGRRAGIAIGAPMRPWCHRAHQDGGRPPRGGNDP